MWVNVGEVVRLWWHVRALYVALGGGGPSEGWLYVGMDVWGEGGCEGANAVARGAKPPGFRATLAHTPRERGAAILRRVE